MGFISKYLLRGAGFLVAAQIFMTLRMTGDDFVEKLLEAVKLAMFAIPLLAAGAFAAAENGLRTAGFTIMFWAGAGAAGFFGTVYGDPEANRIPGLPMPDAAELNLAFGITNLVCVVLLGLGLWLWGLKCEPPPGTYHDLGVPRR